MISHLNLANIYPIHKLCDVVDFLDNLRKPIKESERINGEYPYYGANGLQSWVNDYIFDEKLVLLAEDGGHFDNPDRGIAYIIEGKSWVNNHAHVLKAKPIIDTDYLFRVLQNYDVTPWITGSTRAKLTKAGASDILIPLPPLEEQRRIASILDKADDIRQKRQQAIAKLDELLQATFIDMFGDPLENPKKFPIKKLSEFYIDPKNGTKCGPFGSALKREEYTDSGIPVWSMDVLSLKGEFHDQPSLWISDKKYSELEMYAVIEGDILISRAGTVGKMGVVRSRFEKSIISTNLIRLRFGNKLRPDYFVSLMTFCKTRLPRLKTGADGAFTHMNTGILDNLEFPYPKIEIQDEYLKIYVNIQKQKKALLKSASHFDDLFNALQQKAFNGTL